MRRLNPVEIPNIRQNTPSYDDLQAQIAADEAARHPVDDLDQEIRYLISALYAEQRQFHIPAIADRQDSLPRKGTIHVRNPSQSESEYPEC